jgi:hypothetical protein
MSPDPVNTTSGLQLSEFGSLEPGSQGHHPPWLRRHLLPQSSKPLNQTHDDHQDRFDRQNSFNLDSEVELQYRLISCGIFY